MISFYQQDSSFEPSNKRALKNWIKAILNQHHKKSFQINYVFCSDDALLKINRDFLQHDYYTDIITFNNSTMDDSIESDIFISVDRVRENCVRFQVTFEEELHRVMIHGVLHLLGFHDKTTKQKELMRQMENQCLELRKKHYLR